MTDITTRESIIIDAPIDRVWRALTDPEWIKQWFFGVDTETDWKKGSPIVHRGEYQGKPYEDKGTILEVDPPTLLVHSHWGPASGVADSPENYEQVSWELSDHDGGTELVISESNLASEEAKSVSLESWRMVLGNLKRLLES